MPVLYNLDLVNVLFLFRFSELPILNEVVDTLPLDTIIQLASCDNAIPYVTVFFVSFNEQAFESQLGCDVRLTKQSNADNDKMPTLNLGISISTTTMIIFLDTTLFYYLIATVVDLGCPSYNQFFLLNLGSKPTTFVLRKSVVVAGRCRLCEALYRARSTP